jgi:hypothetical protein
MTEIEAFLHQAILQGKVEKTLNIYAQRKLREAMGWIRARISFYGLDGITPSQQAKIRQLRQDVEEYMGGMFAGDLKSQVEGSKVLNDFVDRQMELARGAVEATGGTVSRSLTTEQVINQGFRNVTINGIPWDEFVGVRLPRAVADKVSRFVTLGLLDSEAKTVAAFDNVVVRTTKTQVEALITTGVHDTGSIAQQLIYQIETSPAWQEDNQQVWSAMLDSSVCATCVGKDGQRYPIDYIKVSPHPNCRCVLLPESFFTQDGQPVLRPVDGDKGVTEIRSTKKATEAWLKDKDSKATANSIFGVKRADRLREGKISLDQAVKEMRGR